MGLMGKNILLSMMAAAMCALPSFAQVSSDSIPATDNVRQEIRNAFNNARRAGTVEAWEIFINNYPESLYIEQARKMRDHAIVNSYCNPATTLERLVNYIEDNVAHEPRIRMFYANLVNNPTHSYRYEHMDIGFDGCTGRVDEHIEMADGSRARDNYFIFDDKGLLVEQSIMGRQGKPRVATYTYAYNNLHSYSLKTCTYEGKKSTGEATYDANDKLASIAIDDSRWTYSYNDLGSLVKLVSTAGKYSRTLVYNDGHIVREETAGKVYRYLYDYDSATMKRYLIGINEMQDGEVIHELKVDYSIDSKGRVTRAEITLDGKPQMTITRKYSK